MRVVVKYDLAIGSGPAAPAMNARVPVNTSAQHEGHSPMIVMHTYLTRSESGGPFKDLDLLGPPGKDYSFEIECVEVIEFNVD